jgi:hypothetical protein
MSFKKTDLYKNLRMKVQGQMHKAPVSDRFAGQGEALVPFTTKLPKALVKQLQTQALIKGVPTGELVATFLRAGLGEAPAAELAAAVSPVAAKAPAKVPALKKVVAPQPAVKAAPAKKAAAKKAGAQPPVVPAPAKKVAAKKAVAKKAPQAQTSAKKIAARKVGK